MWPAKFANTSRTTHAMRTLVAGGSIEPFGSCFASDSQYVEFTCEEGDAITSLYGNDQCSGTPTTQFNYSMLSCVSMGVETSCIYEGERRSH